MASDGTVKIKAELDSEKAKSSMKEFSSVAKKSLDGVKVAVAAVSAAMTALAGYSIKVGSDFEAGMSKVSAISGATGEELGKLTDKAKEMGAKTKFSATEAASAFEYMAMAGWKTEDMLNGIEGIMNLAAASGEDLATTSDIVTDALTAFGLSASDSSHFADVLAKASSSANTNVSMMGETFKYVAPVAGSLGFSVEDCAVAIGLMANSGIKASQAGTSLRQIFTNLVKPTDAMQGAMDKLGISLTDNNGKMKSLDSIMWDLRDGFSGLTEAEKAQYAATLAGQEGMSGFLAIVNASEADFNSLKDSINNADGSAENMAETMNDNLKGSITILGSAVEGFGIKVYENMEEPLKDAVDKGTDCVNRLASAFDSGGIQEVVEETGEIFNDLADEISESSDAARGIVAPLRNVGNTAWNIGKTSIPIASKAFEKLAENLDIVVPLLVSGATAIKVHGTITKSVSKLTKAYAAEVALLNRMEKQNALQLVATNGGLTVQQTLIALHNGQIGITTALTGLWTKAQIALNTAMKSNAIGFVVTSAAALAAGLATLAIVTDKSKEKNYELTNSEKKLLNSCKEVTDSLNDQRAAREESVQAIDMEYDSYQSLLSELQSVTDENGKVKSGYEERAKVITGQLADALGTEIELTDGVIQNYQETVDAIKEVIVQKKAEALCAALQEEMAEAYKNSKEALLSYKDAVAVAEKKQRDLEEAQAKYNEVSEMYAGNTGPKALSAIRDAERAVEDAQDAFDEASGSVDETRTSLNELSAEVNNYDALVEAMQSGTVAEIESAMNSLVSGYQSYTEEMLASSQTARDEMIAQAQETTSALSVLAEEGGQMYQAFGEDAANAAVKAVSEFQKLPGGIETAVNEIGTDGAAAMVSALAQADFDGKLSEESQKSYQAFLDGLSALPEGTRTAILAALEPMMTETEFSKIQLRINGQDAGNEFADGVSSVSDKSNKAGKENADAANAGAKSLNLTETGEKAGSQYASGVGSKSKDANAKGKLLGDNAKSGADSADSYSAGSDFGSGFVNGIGSWIKSAANKAAELAKSALSAAKKALDSHSPSKKAKKIGRTVPQGLGGGIEEDADIAIKASEEMSKASLDAIDTDVLSDKIKNLDVPDIMSRFYMAVDDRQERTARNVTSAVSARENAIWNNNRGSDMTRITDEDLQKIEKIIARNPVVSIFNVDSHEVSKTFAIPMDKEIQKNQKFSNMLKGVR